MWRWVLACATTVGSVRHRLARTHLDGEFLREPLVLLGQGLIRLLTLQQPVAEVLDSPEVDAERKLLQEHDRVRESSEGLQVFRILLEPLGHALQRLSQGELKGRGVELDALDLGVLKQGLNPRLVQIVPRQGSAQMAVD